MPIQLLGLTYGVIIFDDHIKIGCEFHSIVEWFAFSDREIAEMDGREALSFWHQWKNTLLEICESAGRCEINEVDKEKQNDRQRNHL